MDAVDLTDPAEWNSHHVTPPKIRDKMLSIPAPNFRVSSKKITQDHSHPSTIVSFARTYAAAMTGMCGREHTSVTLPKTIITRAPRAAAMMR